MLGKCRRNIVWLIVVWLGVSTLACGTELDSSPTAAPTAVPQPVRSEPTVGSEELAKGAPGQAGSRQAGLTVVNNTDTEMCYIYISLSANATWGPDRLGDDETVPVGRSRTFSLSPGTWDVRIEDCSENVILEKGEIVISGNYTLTVTGSSGSSGSAGSTCGNGICEADEDVYTCDVDCGICGDGLCTTFENEGNCPSDCGSSGYCGDGICNAGEDVYTCDVDCGFCGDGLCTTFENAGNCPSDCGSSGYCGDGVCNAGEDVYTCDMDCGFCGDGLCTVFENAGNCPSDCSE
ncbi:MAG: hypothetical protein JXB30_02430 [Anaerolineae bacterium]|nr:hypothetical protein [Anaerolineae bacterium]